MPIGEICNRDVIISHREDTVADAAKLMREHHVGDVVVVDERDGLRFPVGIVTDRDLVVEIMATELDQKVITVGDIMLEELVTVKESVGIFEAVAIHAQQDGEAPTGSGRPWRAGGRADAG